jgi:hypothetical protein
MFVSADYRLMPESNGLDMLEDLSDFWTWVRGGELQKTLDGFKPGVEADLEKVIAYGESAGGTLALQSGFSQPGFGMYSRELFFIFALMQRTSHFSHPLNKSLLEALHSQSSNSHLSNGGQRIKAHQAHHG